MSEQLSTAVVRVQDMFDEATRSREEAQRRKRDQEQYDKDAKECLETQRRRVAEKDIYKREYTESDRGQRYESRTEQKARDDEIKQRFLRQQKEEWEQKEREKEQQEEKGDDEDEDPEDESNWSEEKKQRMEEVRKDKLITERRERIKLAERLKKQQERDLEDRRLVRNWHQRKKDESKEQDKLEEQKQEDERKRLAQEAESKGYKEQTEQRGDEDEIPSGSKPKPKRKTPRLADILASLAEPAGTSTTKDTERKLRDRGVKRPKDEAEDDEFEEIDDDEKDEDYDEEEGEEEEEEAELEPGAAEFEDEDDEGIPEMQDDIGGPEHVHCANATSAKLYRLYLVRELRELKRNVGLGIEVPKAYENFIASLIRGLLDMKIYMKVENARIDKILELIPDQHCKVWKRMILGRKTLTEGQMAEMYDDLTRPVVKQEEEAKKPTPWEIILQGVEKEATKGNLRRKAKQLFTEVELTHTHAAKVAGYLKEMAEEVPTDEGYLALVECAVRPMVTIFTPKLDDLQHERKVQRKEISKKMKDLLEEGEVDKIAPEVCVPIVNQAWKDSKDVEDQATASLAAMVAWLVRYGMGEKYIVNVTKTASAFHVSRSTLSKMITGKKFYGGKQAKKMKAAGETTSSKGKAGKSARSSRVKKSKVAEKPEEEEEEEEREKPMVH